MGLLLAAAVLAIVMMVYLLLQHKRVFGYSAFDKLKD
jgi:preprotein translocase subunit SecG